MINPRSKTPKQILRQCPQAFIDAWDDFCESPEGRDIAQHIQSYLTERLCFGGVTDMGAVVTGEWDSDPLYAGLLGACGMLGNVPEEASRRLLANPDDWKLRRAATYTPSCNHCCSLLPVCNIRPPIHL